MVVLIGTMEATFHFTIEVPIHFMLYLINNIDKIVNTKKRKYLSQKDGK